MRLKTKWLLTSLGGAALSRDEGAGTIQGFHAHRVHVRTDLHGEECLYVEKRK